MSWILSFDANAENKKNNYRNDMSCSLFLLTAEGLLRKQILNAMERYVYTLWMISTNIFYLKFLWKSERMKISYSIQITYQYISYK